MKDMLKFYMLYDWRILSDEEGRKWAGKVSSSELIMGRRAQKP